MSLSSKAPGIAAVGVALVFLSLLGLLASVGVAAIVTTAGTPHWLQTWIGVDVLVLVVGIILAIAGVVWSM